MPSNQPQYQDDSSSLVELTGIERFDDKIRKRAEIIATERGMTVDELLNTVCCSEGPGYTTTYGQLYAATFLEGYREGMPEAAHAYSAAKVKEPIVE